MKNAIETRNLSVNAVCEAMAKDPRTVVETEENRYHSEIQTVADAIHAIEQPRRIVLLCGPSSSGKTTTASLLKRALAERGTTAHVVSLDDFYLGFGRAPRLPNGQFDYESIDALDVEHLFRCVQEITAFGKTELPRFDFNAHAPYADTVHLELEEDAAVIFEGIHAFHPKLQQMMPQSGTLRLFINTLSRFVREEGVWLARRDLRLCRRILRDDQFRNSPFSNTMQMWPQVVRGEEMYMFPFTDTADCIIDTTFAYEPCLLKKPLTKLLSAVSDDQADAQVARYLQERLAAFPEMPLSLLPQDSILREFTG